MSNSPEKDLFDWLLEKKDQAASGSELRSCEIRPTVYSVLADGTYIRVGNCESEISIKPGGDVSEFNAKTMLQIMAFADSSATESSKITARERVRRLALEVAQLIYSEQDLGGRRCDVKILKTFRGWSKIQTRLYATVIMPLEINPW